MANGMHSLRERVLSVARALLKFDSCPTSPFTAATILSRLTSASAVSVIVMATDTYFAVIVPLERTADKAMFGKVFNKRVGIDQNWPGSMNAVDFGTNG